MSAAPFNQLPANPDLSDAFDVLKKNILLNFNAHHIGTVQKIDFTRQVANATINYKRTFSMQDPVTKIYSNVLKDYPILQDCPLIILGGGDTSQTFPYKQGDECMVLFNDRDMDAWFAGGGNTTLNTSRLHSFSDAVILVGLRSLSRKLKNYDPVRSVTRGGTAVLGPNPSSSKILLANVPPTVAGDGSLTYTTTLNTLLQELITNIQLLVTASEALVTATAAITVLGVTTGTGASGLPTNATAIAAVGDQLAAAAMALSTTGTQIAGLLE